MIIRTKDVELETEAANPLTFRRMVRRDRHGPLLSLTWIRLEGRHERIVCHESDRVYYILEGTATFEIGDRPAEAADTGDVVFLPRGTPYAFEGSVTYLVMNGPAFRPGSDLLVD